MREEIPYLLQTLDAESYLFEMNYEVVNLPHNDHYWPLVAIQQLIVSTRDYQIGYLYQLLASNLW
jgi:hypothetical protein